MKKIILLCLIYSSLFSSDINKAIDLFNKNRYQESIDILIKLSQNDLSNNKINFYLGRSYYQIKDYEQALVYFERITISNEEDLRARVELSQTYLMLGLDYDALENFNFVLKNNIPLNVKKNVENKIKYIENKKQKHNFKFLVGFGYTYDNNVNNVPTDNKHIIPNNLGITDYVTTNDKVTDKNMLFLVNGHHKYKISDDNLLENKLTILQQNYDKQKDKDLELLSYDLSLSKYIKEDKFTYGLNFAKVSLDDKSYLDINGLFFNYEKKILSNIYSFLSFKYFDKKYKEEENKKLDSNSYSVAIGNTLPTNKYGIYNFIYIYTKENLKKEDPDTTDKLTNTLIAKNKYKITDKLSTLSSISMNHINESSYEPTFRKKQKINLYNIAFGLSYNIDKTLNITSTIKHIQNDSNIDIYSYEKQTLDIFIKKSF